MGAARTFICAFVLAVSLTWARAETTFCPASVAMKNCVGDGEETPSPDLGGEFWRRRPGDGEVCQFYWWLKSVENSAYPPLRQWVQLAIDGTLEANSTKAVLVKSVYDALGPPPVPPRSKLDQLGLPKYACSEIDDAAARRLSEKLRTMNLRRISPALINELTDYCVTFEVAIPAWVRMSASIISAFVLPIGDTNIVFIGRPDFSAPVPLEYGISSDKLSFSAAGTCSVTEDPKACIERMLLLKAAPTFGFQKGYKKTVKALPFGTDLDAFHASRSDTPIEFQFEIDGTYGGMSFYKGDDARGLKKIDLLVTEDSGIVLLPRSSTCTSSGLIETVYPLLAFPSGVQNLRSLLVKNTPVDFPRSNRLRKTVSEKGCNNRMKYSDWAAATANAAYHKRAHGMGPHALYGWIAEQLRWYGESVGYLKTSHDQTQGAWRHQRAETVIPRYDPLERQAINFARTEREGYMQFRSIAIEGTPATEVWFYAKPIAVGTKETKEEEFAKIVIVHLENDVYTKPVIGRLEGLLEGCASPTHQKDEFIAAVFALFNSAPLQQGEEVVGKVFMSVMYQSIFGRKLASGSALVDISLDAMTMTFEDFKKKYSPVF